MDNHSCHKAAVDHLLKDQKTFHVSGSVLKRNILITGKPLFYLILIIFLPFYIFGAVSGFPLAVNMTTGLNMPGFNQGTGVVQEVIHRTIKDEGPHPKSRTVCDVKVKYVSADNNASAKSQSESLKQINNIGCQINTGDKISYIYNVKSNEGTLTSPASTTALLGNFAAIVIILSVLIWHILKAILYITGRLNFAKNANRYTPLKLSLQIPEYLHFSQLSADIAAEKKQLEEKHNACDNTGKNSILTRIRIMLRLFNLKMLFTKLESSRCGEYQAVNKAPGHNYFLSFSFLGSRKVCYLYGIKESKLKAVTGKQNEAPENGTTAPENDRTIFFIGPWISPDKEPAQYMNIVFSGDDAMDYCLKESPDK